MKAKQQMAVLLTKALLILLISFLSRQILSAQDSLHFKKVPYKATISTIASNPAVAKGYLNALTDSSITLSPVAVRFHGYENNSAGLPAYHYNNISEIRLRRTGSTARGILIGMISGAVTGAIIGYASGDDTYNGESIFGCFLCFTAGEKAAAAGAGLGVAGGIIGGVIGALVHKTFIINGKKESFDELKWKLIN